MRGIPHVSTMGLALGIALGAFWCVAPGYAEDADTAADAWDRLGEDLATDADTFDVVPYDEEDLPLPEGDRFDESVDKAGDEQRYGEEADKGARTRYKEQREKDHDKYRDRDRYDDDRDDWRGPSWRRGGPPWHRDHIHCEHRWVPDYYRIVRERRWVPGYYEEVVVPWKVEWTWVAHRPHDNLLTVINDDPDHAPPRPDWREYGRGHWEKRILQEYCVRKEWVPGRYEIVKRKVRVHGHYEHVCHRH